VGVLRHFIFRGQIFVDRELLLKSHLRVVSKWHSHLHS